MTEEEYLQHREHCVLMAEIAPTEHIRASLLRMARLCEIEATNEQFPDTSFAALR